jgi:hypothetical protein
MNSATRLLAFAGALALVTGAGIGIGSAAGPIHAETTSAEHAGEHGGGHAGDTLPKGVSVSEAGYRLAVESSTLAADTPAPFRFQIIDPDGRALTRYQTLHDRDLHLIVVSRNLVDYMHLHPTLDGAGTWSVDLPALAPGSYRVLADFQPVGAENLTLGVDVSVPGEPPNVSIPDPATSDEVDGFTVTLSGAHHVGAATLAFDVTRDGAPVRTEEYLGAAGHLVIIRDGDMAYLHVHPAGDGASTVTFEGELPTPGRYRLFFDFQVGGVVRTADFTVEVQA